MLDLVFINVPEVVHSARVLSPLSDHLPILLYTHLQTSGFFLKKRKPQIQPVMTIINIYKKLIDGMSEEQTQNPRRTPYLKRTGDQYWLEKNPIFTRYGMTGIVSSLGASGKASQRRRYTEKQ